jgi:hypothetical protein
VRRGLPHLGDNGRGVNHGNAREPGVRRGLPHLSDDGQGVNTAATREPGVIRGLPHLSNDGRGVNRPQTREPGVSRDRPHLGDNGQGVARPQTREPGVIRDRPEIVSGGRGVNRPQTREPGVLDPPGPEHGQSALDDWGHEYHDLVMPELIRWFRYLSARLRHVRILNGDWSRLVTSGAAWTLPVRQGHGPAGVFLDPPYSNTERAGGLYAEDDGSVAAACREWALEAGDNPKWRIVLAGYDTEHDEQMEAAGWTCHEWFTSGFLTGGMANVGGDGHQQDRERLWASPHCVPAERALSLF